MRSWGPRSIAQIVQKWWSTVSLIFGSSEKMSEWNSPAWNSPLRPFKRNFLRDGINKKKEYMQTSTTLELLWGSIRLTSIWGFPFVTSHRTTTIHAVPTKPHTLEDRPTCKTLVDELQGGYFMLFWDLRFRCVFREMKLVTPSGHPNSKHLASQHPQI